MLKVLIVLSVNCFSVIDAAGQMAFGLPEIKIIKESVKSLENSTCRLDLNTYIDNIYRNEKNALTMFDSMVKFPFGLIDGNMYQLGNFDECISVTLNMNDDSNRTAMGQYCLIDILINITLSKNVKKKQILEPNEVYWAVCIPSSCTANQANNLTKIIISKIMPGKPITATVNENACYYHKNLTFEKFTKLQICFSVLILGYLLFVCCATVCHTFVKYKTARALKYAINDPNATKMKTVSCLDIIEAFSLFKNMKILFATIPDIECKQNNLCGMRVLSMSFMFVGNALLFLFCAPHLNNKIMKTSLSEWQNAVLLNNPLMLDTFLMTSGFKAYWIIVNEMKKSSKWNRNIFRLVLMRFCKYMPAYIVMILFYATFIEDIGSGPLWKERMHLERERCLSSWWTNLIFLNNYWNVNKLCITQSWYLSVDTQLFLTAPLLSYPLIHKRKFGYCLLLTVCILTTTIPFIITSSNHLDLTLLSYPKDITDLGNNHYFTTYFIKTHMKANAYFYGISVAYIIQRLSTKSYNIPKILQVVISLMAIISGFASIYSVIILYKSDYISNSTEATIYAPLHRIGWCLTVAWILIVCMNDNSLVSNFLGHKIWISLNRLLYCSYLVNGFVELYCYGQTRSPRHLSSFNLTCEVLSHILLTLFGGFLLHILFECPTHTLKKVFQKCGTKAKEPVSNLVEIGNVAQPNEIQESPSHILPSA